MVVPWYFFIRAIPSSRRKKELGVVDGRRQNVEKGCTIHAAISGIMFVIAGSGIIFFNFGTFSVV